VSIFNPLQSFQLGTFNVDLQQINSLRALLKNYVAQSAYVARKSDAPSFARASWYFRFMRRRTRG
jgi:hypothetical protein